MHSLVLCVLFPSLPLLGSSLSVEGEHVAQGAPPAGSTRIARPDSLEASSEWVEAEWKFEPAPEPDEADVIFTSERSHAEPLFEESEELQAFLDTVALQDPFASLEQWTPIMKAQPIEPDPSPPVTSLILPVTTEDTALPEEASSSSAARDSEPVLIEASQPVYPRLARRAGWEGIAVCRITVSPAGDVTDARIERSSGHELLDEAALRALLTWRFQPALVNRVASEFVFLHSVRFQLQPE